MSGFDQNSIAVPLPTVTGTATALGGPYKIKPSEAFSSALMTVSGLTGETISVQTSPDGYWGAPASPTFYRTDWRGTQQLYSTARTNRALRSQEFDDATAWGVSTAGVTFPGGANTIVAPDGSTTAERATFAVTTSYRYQVTAGLGVLTGRTFTVSCWLKSPNKVNVGLRISDAAVGTDQTKVAVTLTNQWVRWSATRTFTSADTGINFGLENRAAIAGDGIAGDIDVWGWQLEEGAAATSYIPTTTAAVPVTDYTLSNGAITLAVPPLSGATLSYDNSVLPSPYFIFATGDGTRTAFAYDGVWGTLSTNSGKGNGIWQIDLRGAQALRLVKSAGVENATVNMTLKRDALQYKNTAGTWTVT